VSVSRLTRLPPVTREWFDQYADRFWSKVTKQENGCWVWRDHVTGSGYGQVFWGGKGEPGRVVHRIAYEALVGPLPAGLPDLDHLCRNRRCVNPDHLEPVTRRENVRRGVGHTAINMRKTHCPKGHEYTPGNTKVGNSGGRYCRACAELYNERRRLARSA
jgi:hypothetical protein